MRWLRLLTRITYSSMLIGILSLAAFLQSELFRGHFLYWGKQIRHNKQRPICFIPLVWRGR
ncbi:hypothetical protein CWS43_19515 [Rahnella sp. AA]|nr:hypothetical protein CWS43_19515 [Rahnella sp. AA]